jgi:hypothetical protein
MSPWIGNPRLKNSEVRSSGLGRRKKNLLDRFWMGW